MSKGKAAAKIGESRIDRGFTVINYILLSIALVLFAYPLIYVLSASFSSGRALTMNRVWLWPVDFNLEGYIAVFNYRLIINGFTNSFFYMTLGTAISIVMTLLAGYPLSRKDFYGRNVIMFLFTFTMLFSGGLIPFYILVRNLGMRNTVWSMVIPGAMSVFNVILTRTFFLNTIPDELLEASQIDGCSDFKFVGKVVLPLSTPILAVMGLFYAVGYWNSYFNAMIFLDKSDMYPLQLVLRQILVKNTVDFSMISNAHFDLQSEAVKLHLAQLLKYSLIIVASAPMLILYPFVQKFFVKGIMIGSIKG